jgi:hypothetical protein
VNARNEATGLLDELGINELPIVPVDICNKLQIHYSEDILETIDGMLILDMSRNQNLICINSQINEQSRKNFTIAHELGHLCLHSFTQKEFYCSSAVIESFKSTLNAIELSANEFASELLMPFFIYQPLVAKMEVDWDRIKELASLSKTSLQATAIRFIDLTQTACCLIISQSNNVIWFHRSKDFQPYVQMQSRLLSKDSIAYSIFRGAEPPDHFEDVKADNWLTGRGINKYTEILEWSLPLNSYGQVLTLLYDEEGIAGWDEEDEGDEGQETEWEPPTFHKSKRK